MGGMTTRWPGVDRLSLSRSPFRIKECSNSHQPAPQRCLDSCLGRRVLGTQDIELRSTYAPLVEEACLGIAGRDRKVLDLRGLES
jgi:hypothetical protein